MAEKKTFIGYDLGDGETITDLAVLDHNSVKDRVQTLFNAMTMPDNNTAGQAIPTVYGYTDDGRIVFSSSILTDPESVRDIRISFKRCPSDLMPSMTEGRRQEILAEMEKGWPSQEACPELYSKKMRGFIDAVVSFTNAIFHDEKYKRSIQDASVDSDEIIFCVGHPTRLRGNSGTEHTGDGGVCGETHLPAHGGGVPGGIPLCEGQGHLQNTGAGNQRTAHRCRLVHH